MKQANTKTVAGQADGHTDYTKDGDTDTRSISMCTTANSGNNGKPVSSQYGLNSSCKNHVQIVSNSTNVIAKMRVNKTIVLDTSFNEP